MVFDLIMEKKRPTELWESWESELYIPDNIQAQIKFTGNGTFSFLWNVYHFSDQIQFPRCHNENFQHIVEYFLLHIVTFHAKTFHENGVRNILVKMP